MYRLNADLNIDLILTAPRQVRLSSAWLTEKSDEQEENGGEGNEAGNYKMTGLVFFKFPQGPQLRRLLQCGKCWRPMGDDCYRRYCPHISLNHTLKLRNIVTGKEEDTAVMFDAVVMSSEELKAFRERYG